MWRDDALCSSVRVVRRPFGRRKRTEHQRLSSEDRSNEDVIDSEIIPERRDGWNLVDG